MIRSRTTALRLAALMVVSGLLVSACGLPVDDQPRVIASDRLTSSEPATIATAVQTAETSELKIYMVKPDGPDSGSQLIFVERVIESQPEAILNQLLIGPSPDERSDFGLSSALTGRATFAPTSVDEQARIAYVGLTEGSLRGVVSEDQRLAFAQIVFSLSQLPEIDSVVFSLGGDQVSVPTDTGTSEPGAQLTIADFEAFYPRPSVDFGLSEPAVPTTTSFAPEILATTRPAQPTAELFIWLVQPNEQLVAVVRDIERSPEAIIANLTAGPNAEEADRGFTTVLPPDSYVNNGSDIDVNESSGTAILDLGPGSLPGLADDKKLRAVAQIVMSLTGLAEIREVSFYENGEPLAVPTDSGVTKPAAPVNREDFASLLTSTPPLPDPPPIPPNVIPAPIEDTEDLTAVDEPTDTSSTQPAVTAPTPTPTPTGPTPTATPVPATPDPNQLQISPTPAATATPVPTPTVTPTAGP